MGDDKACEVCGRQLPGHQILGESCKAIGYEPLKRRADKMEKELMAMAEGGCAYGDVPASSYGPCRCFPCRARAALRAAGRL